MKGSSKAREERISKRVLLTLIDRTLTEEGCINFDLHQDNDNKNLFIFYENWESREDWLRHFEKAKDLDDKTQFNDHALDDYTLNEMTMIE